MNDPELNESDLKEPEFDGDISPEEALIIEVDGFEGPLDLLLAQIGRAHVLNSSHSQQSRMPSSA